MYRRSYLLWSPEILIGSWSSEKNRQINVFYTTILEGRGAGKALIQDNFSYHPGRDFTPSASVQACSKGPAGCCYYQVPGIYYGEEGGKWSTAAICAGVEH